MRRTLTHARTARLPQLLCAVLATALGAGAALADDPLDLRVRLKAGDRRTVTLSEQVEGTRRNNGADTKYTQNNRVTYVFDVLKTDDASGRLTMRLTIQRLVMDHRAPGASMKFDSDDPPAQLPAEAAAAAAIVGSSFTFTLSPRGKVLAIVDVEAMRDAITAKLQAVMAPEAIDQFVKVVCSKEKLTQDLNQLLVNYADKATAVGESWSFTNAYTLVLPRLVKTKLTLRRRTGGRAELQRSSTISANAGAKPLTSGPITLSYKDIKGTDAGSLTIDEATGWILTSTYQEQRSMSVTVTVDNLQIPPQTILMSEKVKFTWQTIEPAPGK